MVEPRITTAITISPMGDMVRKEGVDDFGYRLISRCDSSLNWLAWSTSPWGSDLDVAGNANPIGGGQPRASLTSRATDFTRCPAARSR